MRIWFNGEQREFEDNTSVAELLQALQLSPQRVAVEINMELVPRSEHSRRHLAENDRLEVVTLVGGG